VRIRNWRHQSFAGAHQSAGHRHSRPAASKRIGRGLATHCSRSPTEQATVFDLAINMMIARTLGIKFPETTPLRATKVTE